MEPINSGLFDPLIANSSGFRHTTNLMIVLADAFIPFTGVVPAAQIVLFIVIVAIEASVIRPYSGEPVPGKRLWFSVAMANLVTTVIGIVLVFPFACFEGWGAFGWGSQYRQHPEVREISGPQNKGISDNGSSDQKAIHSSIQSPGG
jgi:hypothetical protein